MGKPYEQYRLLKPYKKITRDKAINGHSINIGVSGSGKSTMMVMQALHDAIVKRHSVVFIDSHGDGYWDFMRGLVAMRVKPSRVIPIDLSTHKYGVPKFWLLDHKEGYEYVAVDGLLSAVRDIPMWRTSIGERMVDVLRHLFMVIQATDTPFTECNRFLTDKEFRHQILKKANNKNQWAFWLHLYSMSDGAMVIESSRNKLSQIISNPLLAPAFDSTYNSYSTRMALDTGMIIPINLNQQYFKAESRSLLGSFFLFLKYQAIIEREDTRKRWPISMFLDEFFEYATPPFFMPYITSSRKWGVSLYMASQNLNRYDVKDLYTILGNVATIVVFGCGYDDARTITPHIWSFYGDEYVSAKERQGWDLYGKYGKSARYYSAGEEQRNAQNELINQARQECIVRVKEHARTRVWLARVADAPTYRVSDAQLDDFLARCAATHYCNTARDVEPEPEDGGEPDLWD